MAIGDVSVRVVPDATDFWRSFRARTAGQANNEGRRQGEAFGRGLQETAGRSPIRIRADTAQARAGLASVESEIRRISLLRLDPRFDDKRTKAQIAELKAQLAGLSTRPDINTTRARAQLAALSSQVQATKAEERSLERQGNQSGGGLLKALLPLAPALAPLAGAAIAAGSGLAVLGGAGILALTGLKREMDHASAAGNDAAAAVGAVKGELHTLQATAAKAALPGLEASVVAIKTELPALRQVIGEQATVAGQVIAHLTRGVVGGFTTFRPIISAVGSDVDTLAAHFETFATGPGGARFAKTLTTDYAEVKPVIESVGRAVVDIARAASQGGLGILHILGEVANVIDSFPRPVLTAIVDGFLLFRTVGVASTAIAAVGRAFASVKSAAAGVAAATQIAATQRIAAEAAAAAATSEAEAAAAEAMLATAEAARAELLAVATSRGELSADQTAAMQVQLAIADREIASYEEVALAARASAAVQAAAAEEAAGAAAATRGAAGAGSLAGKFGKILGPVALVATAIPLLSSLFGDNGQAAQEAAAAVDGYTSALVASSGAIDATVRSQVAKNIADKGLFDIALKAGVSQAELTDAVIAGGSALDATTAKVGKYQQAQGTGNLTIAKTVNALRDLSHQFQTGAHNADQQRAAVDTVTASVRAHAAALHTDAASYEAARAAAAKSTEQTRQQTVAFQLENDAASLLNNALKLLAGQNLDVASAQTSFEVSTKAAIASLKKNKDAITGHRNAALADQQAVQGSVSAARQYAEAVAKQTGSSSKAAAAYRHSRDEVLALFKAHGVLTPAVRRYINTLFDVKGVSDYLSKHPTKLDADTAAVRAKVQDAQARIDAIHQRQAIGIGMNTIEAENEISRIQGLIDALHGKTVVITTITPDGKSVSVGNQGRGFGLATGGLVSGPGTGTSDSIPAWLSNGEYVVNAKATAKHRHLLDNINKGVRGFAAGGPVGGITHSGKDWIFDGKRYASQRSAENAQAAATKATTQQRNSATNDLVSVFNSLRGAISGTVADMRHAFAQLVKDFKTAGVTTRQFAQIQREGAKLVANQQKLTAARTLLSNIHSYGDTVRGALTGGFDPTKFGSVKDLIAGYSGQTTQNKAYKTEVDALRKRAGKNKAELGLINTLAASGQTASLESLYGSSAADLANAGKAYTGYNASVSSGVGSAEIAKYGKTEGQASTDVKMMVERQDRLIAVLARLGSAVAASHGKSGDHAHKQLEHLAHELEVLVRHGRALT